MTITSVDSFALLFPNGSVKQNGEEWASPCPFCTDGAHSTKNGIDFYGEDRLVWWTQESRFYCRSCAREGRGRGGNGVYTAQDMGDRLGVEVAESLDASSHVHTEKPLSMLWTQQQVSVAHARVDRTFWYRYGWDDPTINHFQLGRGVFYSVDGDVNIIPMHVQKPYESPLKDYAVAIRAAGKLKKHNPGSFKPYYWLIERYKNSKTIAVAEGEKDGISLSLLGWNVAVAFGANTWTEDKTLFLKALGYEEIIVFGDNDEAGVMFSRRVAEMCQRFGIPVRYADWSNSSEALPKWDVTEALVVLGHDRTRSHLESLLAVPERITPRLKGSTIQDFSRIDPNYTPEKVTYTPLEDVRGDGPMSIRGSIRRFLEDYDNRQRKRRGRIKLLSVGPGAGKTHTLVQVVEQQAKAYKEFSLLELAGLHQQLAEYEAAITELSDDPEQVSLLQKQITRTKYKIEHFSFSTISWFGQYKEGWLDLIEVGADPSLWYNFEARNEDNCQNFDIVQKLANKNHDIGAYCKLGCPFKQECARSGYLQQEEEARQFPIVFYRHQHLRQPATTQAKKLVVIDESPLSQLDTAALTFRAKDVTASRNGWEVEPEDKESVDAILLFVKAVENTLRLHQDVPKNTAEDEPNPEYMLYGNALIRKIDQQVRGLSEGDDTLESLLSKVDDGILRDLYQPNFTGGDEAAILPRCVPQFVETLRLEMPDYSADSGADRSSLMFLVGGVVEVYPAGSIKVPARTPVIVADATATIPELYEAMFNRDSDMYAPVIRNPNAEIKIVTGSDWTLGQIRSQIGKQLKERKEQKATVVTTMLGEEIDISEFPVSDEMYGAPVVRDALALIRGLAARHKDLFVITHKTWREPLETAVRGSDGVLEKKVAFGHFGALRGTNAYKNYEAAMLLGMFRIPYEVVFRRAQVWMRHINPTNYEKIDPITTVKLKPYPGTDKGHGYRTFDHWLADALVNQIEESEMIQCVERIRPHATRERKVIYILANRPFAPFSTEFISKAELLTNLTSTKRVAVFTDLHNAWKEDRQISTRQLSKTHSISLREAVKWKKEFMSEVSKTQATKVSESGVS